MLVALESARPDDADLGGKAAGLARLAAAGLPVPPTRVLTAAAYRAARAAHGAAGLATAPLAPDVLAALDAALAALGAPGAPLLVRSSATCEDQPAAAAPGLFRSVAGVRSRAALHDAVRAVWASLHDPIATTYLVGRGVDPAGAAMAVVLQPELATRAAGTIYTRAPGRPDELLVEIAARTPGGTPALVALDRATLAARTPDAHLAPDTLVALARLALAAETALGAPADGADVEWVLAPAPVLVQARAIATPRAAPPELPAGALAFSAAEPDAVWIWDAAHNPAPLSPAQAGLVELVDRARVAPLRQRVVDGYLYYTTHAAPPAPPPVPAAELARRWHGELRPALARALAPLLADPPPPLDDALAAYLDFYRGYAALAVSLRAARHAAPPEALQGADLHAREVPLCAISWDVADAAPAASLSPGQRIADPGDDVVAQARAAATIGEEDDVLFAAAQTGVRRALAALAARWRLPLDVVTHLPLDEVRTAAAGPPPPDATARAAAAAATRAAQARRAPPARIAAGRALHGVPPATAGALLRGLGGGGRARGPVHRLEQGVVPVAGAAPAGRIVVAPTILPGMAVLLRDAAGLVAEHGGPLGHGAALARELGLPHVVGCAGALATLREGDVAWIDGESGVVLKVEKR